jgi:membrane-associated phospholipid phosphatase
MMSMGGFTGFLVAVSMSLRYDIPLLIIASILISGFLGTARIKLNAHNPPQVYAGYITGALVMLSLFFYFRS